MAGWLAVSVALGVRAARRRSCVLPPCAALLTRGSHQLCDRPPPVCSKAHISSLPGSNGWMQHNSCHASEPLQVEDEFLTHLDARGQQMEGSLSLLLLLTAHRGDDASIHCLLEQARASGVRPSGYTMEKILHAYIRRKHLNAAVSLYGSIQREYPEPSLQSCTVLHLCTMLVESGQCLEAMQILREFVKAGKRPEVPPKNAAESCKLLLSKASETGNYEVAKGMFDLLLLGRLVDPGPQVVVPLLQCKLDRGDLHGTVEVAEYIYCNFNTLPKRMEIFIRLMQHKPPTEQSLLPVLSRDTGQTREDADLLARMFDLVQSCYGPTQAQHDLLFTCLESGYPDAARLVLQTLADDVDGRQLLRMCKIYAKNEREAALEYLLIASKGMTNIDRQKIYEILLDAYRLSGKVGEKAVFL